MKRGYWLGLFILLGLIGWRYIQYQRAKVALPARDVLIQQALDRRLTDYTQKLRDKCRRDALEAAREIADSIAFAKADALMLFDTLSRPPKPNKPDKPERMPLEDSLQVKPLIDSL